MNKFVNFRNGVVICIFLVVFHSTVNCLPCVLREYKHGLVCVCNSTYCDTLDVPDPNGINEFILVSSSKGGLRFSVTKGEFSTHGEKLVIDDYGSRIRRESSVPIVLRYNERSFNFFNFFSASESSNEDVTITVNRSKTYQKIVGFGGAFTGAVSHNLDKITDQLQKDVYNMYFSKNTGLAYNMIRISIGGCDFDLAPWAYNEAPINDNKLSNFTVLDARDEYKIEQIKELMRVSNNFNIKIMGAAWSSPKWMKSNNEWTGRSHLKPEFYQTWADYHIKFLELMAAKNISLWAISTGNEPGNGVIGWLFVHFMSLGWTAKDQAKWVGENLGPTLRNSAFRNVKLFSPDDQRYVLPTWLTDMDKSYPNSTSYLDGVAVHWYWDSTFSPILLDEVHSKFEDKIILNTESCVGDKPLETHGPELGSWERGEKYIRSYIEDLVHWVNGWIDWNIILDEQGGPNYVDNFVDAPVIVNTTSGDELYKQPMFYGIGHFSRFFEPDSIRVDAQSSDMNVETVGFQRTDGSIALLVFNSKRSDIDVTISDSKRGNIVLRIPRNSVHTLIYN